MGAKSTLSISREEALEKITYFLTNASDVAIADVLEVLNDDAGFNDKWLGVRNFMIER